MFTGLVEGVGEIRQVKRLGEGLVLSIMPLFPMEGHNLGDSIAVDGVCLTVTGLGAGGAFDVDVSGETLMRSTTGQLKQGDKANLERALRLTDRLGGHLVTGHVDGTGRIIKKEQIERFRLLRISLDPALSRYTIEKGSIAVDGISLTINRCEETFFEVTIIPQTGRETHLLKKKAGEPVNIETDLIGKYVEKFFKADRAHADQKRASVIDREMLIKYGFSE
ncbi:MAG: riboflavin synthase [Pseudomonadota bacterium]